MNNYDYSLGKERLRLKMTNEERGFYSSILEIADKNMTGKLEGKIAANFLKKSGWDKNILKQIWLIAAQTDPSFLEKDEFYIALRLVALAQNNMEYSAESIRLNYPIPPLPKFDLKSESANQSLMSNPSFNQNNTFANTKPQSNFNQMSGIEIESKYFISPQDTEKYEMIFLNSKDKDSSISIIRAKQIWLSTGIPNDTINQIINWIPLNNLDYLTNRQFHVGSFLVNQVTNAISPPSSLPHILHDYINVRDSLQSNTNSNVNDFNSGMRNQANMPMQNTDIPSNIPNTNNNTASVVDVETKLLKEFNMKPIVHVDKKSDMSHYKGVATLGLVPGVKNLLEQLKMMNAEAEEESKKLNKEWDENLEWLNNFIDDIEKLNKANNELTRKNVSIKEGITDYRRKINIEKDNMAKWQMNIKLLNDEI